MSFLCHKKPNKLEILYSEIFDILISPHSYFKLSYQARLRITSNTLGVYVDEIENDDIDGSCHCTGKDTFATRFKALSIIAEASRNDAATVADVSCSNGDFPVIHRN